MKAGGSIVAAPHPELAMRRLTLTLVLALFLPVALEAQKNCKKGIPCGNTCISATKTCRIGTPASAPAPRAVPAVAVAEQGAAAEAQPSTETASSSAAWVASSRGNTYYRNGCSGGNKLSPANRIYFASEEAAQAAGYSRSRQRGC